VSVTSYTALGTINQGQVVCSAPATGSTPAVQAVAVTLESISVTNASNQTPIVITVGSTTGLANGMTVQVSGVQGNTSANGEWVISGLTSTTFTFNNSAGNGAYTTGGVVAASATAITGASNATPIVITIGSTTGLANGMVVSVSSVQGNTALRTVFGRSLASLPRRFNSLRRAATEPTLLGLAS
jgi:hypothetical protein